MELPRGEMDVCQPEAARVVEIDDMPVDHEPVFRHDEPSGAGVPPAIAAETAAAQAPAPLGPDASLPRTGLAGLHLRTAAEMLCDGDARPCVDTDAFRQGMVVLHAEFGLGKVVALGGKGGERTATVDFASSAGRKKIAIAAGKLKPVR